MAEEVRTKDEQITLLRQSVGFMEEQLAAKENNTVAVAERLALLQRERDQRDDQILVLSEKLQAAQLEVKVGGSQLGRKNDQLQQELATTQEALIGAQRK